MTISRPIDAHVHLWQIERGDYSWLSPESTRLYRDFLPSDVLPAMHETGMAEVILVQAAPTVAETEYLLGVAERNDFVSGVVGWVDLESEGVQGRLNRLARHNAFKGIRPMIQHIDDPDWMLRPVVGRGIEAVREAGLVFEFLVKPSHLPRVRTVLARYPDLRAIIDHGAKPDIANGVFDEWAEQMAALAAETHCYCKLSGLVTEAGEGWTAEILRPYVDHLVAHFGSHRLVFGSDWPVLTMAGSYQEWYWAARNLLSPLGESSVDRIFGLNAVELYGI